MTEDASLNVSMVALHALPVVDPTVPGPIGGTETRAWTLAQGLARYSNAVRPNIVVRGRPKSREVNGVGITAYREPFYDWYVNVGRSLVRRPGFPPYKIARWNFPLLWQLPAVAVHRAVRSRPTDPRQPQSFFAQLSADAFVAFGVQSTAATVIASAHASSRPAAVVLGCDDDLDARYLADADFVNPYGDTGRVCRWSLENADVVFTQTEWQQMTLQERFGRDGVLLRNPIDLDTWTSAASDGEQPTKDQRLKQLLDREAAVLNKPFALWIGRAEGVHKRPQKLIELAMRCPEVPFLMVLNPADTTVEQNVRSSRPANVHIIERVPPDLMPSLVRKAAFLVNTSATEGFPNTYIQAAAVGKPVLSLAVLGEFLVESGLGRAFDDNVGAMADAVNAAYHQGGVAGYDAKVAHDFVRDQHGLETVSRRFEDAICSLVAGGCR